jgi:uncharacterized phage protein (TIGR01671 family)
MEERKIKFRAKNKETKELVYGFLLFSVDCGIVKFCGYNVNSQIEKLTNCVQYTEVKDKNGIEIYEGDIIYGAAQWLERYKPAVVTFRNGSFGLLWHRGDIEVFNPFTSMCNVEYEVVGNIYDNPELMNE